MPSRRGCVMLACLAACSPKLSFPSGAAIACVEDADCPSGLLCRERDGRCADPALPDDTTAPVLISATPSDAEHVVLVFSEAIDAGDTGAYTIVPDLAVLSAERNGDGTVMTLRVTAQVVGRRYTLAVNGLRDTAGNGLPEDTRADFVAFGSTPDPDPPALVLPEMDARVFGGRVVLRWSQRLLARGYTVEVASDAQFTQPLPGSPFAVADPETSLEVALADARTTHWRVRADITRPGAWSQARFEAMGDRIYVYCPAGVCDAAAGVGNKSHPFQTIARGQSEAFSAGLTRVDIASRGGSPYSEQIELTPGVSLYGGYTPDFDDAQRGAETEIAFDGIYTLLAASISSPTVVDGLRIRNAKNPNANIFTVFVLSSNDSLTLNGCHVSGSRHPLWVQTSGSQPDNAPLFSNNVFDEPIDNQSVVYIEESSARFRGNTITSSGAGAGAVAVALQDARAPSFDGNTITAGALAQSFTFTGQQVVRLVGNEIRGRLAIAAQGSEAAWVLANNVISASTVALTLDHPALVVNNAFYVSSSTTGVVQFNARASVTNNLFFNPSDLGVCVTSLATARLDSLQNNLFFNCPDLLGVVGAAAPNCASGTARCVSAAELNDESLTTLGIPGTADANLASSASALHLANVPSDLHYTASSPLAATKGGKDATAPTCGSDLASECGGVAVDKDGKARTCPQASDCSSIGPYEQD